MANPLKVLACTKCSRVLPRTLEFFGANAGSGDGLVRHCRACAVRRAVAWKALHRDLARLYGREAARREWRSNPEAHRARKRRYYARHRERVNEYKRRYREAHPLQIQGEQRRRASRRRGAVGSHDFAQLAGVREAQGGLCFWCHAELSTGLHIDHLRPLCRGGSNWIENIVLSCASCNTSRQGRLPNEWKPSLYPPPAEVAAALARGEKP